MRSKDIQKLYEGLTAEENATLAFSAMLASDSETVADIARSVPRHHYHATDIKFTGRIQGYFRACGLWAIDYWRSYAKMLGAIGLTIDKGATKEDITRAEELELFWERRLIALGLALQTLDDERLIDKAAVMAYAGAMADYSIGVSIDGLPDDAKIYYENMLSAMRASIDGTALDKSVQVYFSGETTTVATTQPKTH